MDGVRWRLLGGVVLSALALSACDDKKAPPLRQNARIIDRAVQVAQDQIRQETGKPGAKFRGVMPWTQALPNRVAVCGQAAVFGEAGDTFVPFVSVVAYAENGDIASVRVEQGTVGSTVEGAGKVYLAMVAHCWENGGPKSSRVQITASPPPTPDNLPDPAARAGGRPPVAPPAAGPRASATSGPGPAPAARGEAAERQGASVPQGATSPVPASTPPPPSTETVSGSGSAADRTPAAGSVAMRQNGNLRASPQGAVVRVVQRGTAMRIFAEAPGGWYEVGDTAPWGWIHSSMLDRR